MLLLISQFSSKINNIQQQPTYQPIAAFLLAFLVFGVVVLKEAHHLLAHDHEEHLHCVATGNEVHFHSADYLPSGCLLCFFNFSPTEKTIVDLTIKEIVPLPNAVQFFYQNKLSLFTHFDIRLRGPPVI